MFKDKKTKRILTGIVFCKKKYLPMQNISNAYPQPYKRLKHSILQSFTEGQKFIRGTNRGLHFCKETNKICKNALFLEYLAYLQMLYFSLYSSSF